jgi:hypothetical protein
MFLFFLAEAFIAWFTTIASHHIKVTMVTLLMPLAIEVSTTQLDDMWAEL